MFHAVSPALAQRLQCLRFSQILYLVRYFNSRLKKKQKLNFGTSRGSTIPITTGTCRMLQHSVENVIVSCLTRRRVDSVIEGLFKGTLAILMGTFFARTLISLQCIVLRKSRIGATAQDDMTATINFFLTAIQISIHIDIRDKQLILHLGGH